MKSYEPHPDIPVWLTALNGQLLTTTELNILNFIFWCNRFGCRTSNDRIGMLTHHSHATVQRAVMKLYSMDLIAIENFGKRTRTLKAVKWPDQESWSKYKDFQEKIEADAAHHAPHILKLDKPPTTWVASLRDTEPPKTGGRILPGGGCPQPPARCSVGGSEINHQIRADIHRDNMIRTGWSEEQATRLTKVKYPSAKFEGSE